MHYPLVRRILPILLCLALFLSSCAVRPGDPRPTDRIRPLLRLAVSLGTDRVLTQNPKAAPLVVDLTKTLIVLFDTGEFATPASVKAIVKLKLDAMKLEPQVRMVIDALIDAVSEELRIAIQRAEIPDTAAMVLVRDLFMWVQEVAQRHVQAPPIVKKLP